MVVCNNKCLLYTYIQKPKAKGTCNVAERLGSTVLLILFFHSIITVLKVLQWCNVDTTFVTYIFNSFININILTSKVKVFIDLTLCLVYV